MRNVKRVNCAVVGGAGFLGSALVDHLVEDRSCGVWVIDNLCAGRREFVNDLAEFVHHDITGSEEFLCKLFRKEKIQYVWNLAAWPYVPTSYSRPLHVFDVNAVGALKVINAAQEAGCEGIVQYSSAEIYGCGNRMGDFDNPEHVSKFLDEDSPVEPHSSYGAAKAAIDSLVQVRWREAKTPVISLRQFNCVGERDILHPYIVPEVARQLQAQVCQACDGEGSLSASWTKTGWLKAKGTRRELHKSGWIYWTPEGKEMEFKTVGGPCDSCGGKKVGYVKLGNDSTRDFIYSGDAVRIAVELMEKGTWGEVYNLGSEESVKMYDLARMIGELMGFREVVVEVDESRKRAWEIWVLQSDNSKVWNAVGKRPLTSLKESLRRTIEWYVNNRWNFPW